MTLDFEIYNKHWDLLLDKYGLFLDMKDLLDFINGKGKKMSETTLQSLKKNGASLPVGIKPNGKWLFGLDSVLRWYFGWEIKK